MVSFFNVENYLMTGAGRAKENRLVGLKASVFHDKAGCAGNNLKNLAVYGGESSKISVTREAKQEQKASEYASVKGASSEIIGVWETVEEEMPDLDYGAVQSANTSVEFVSRAILKQKKRFFEK